MITKKVTEVFSLSDDDKKAIKENAQKIKSHLVAYGYNNCEDFIVCNDYDYWTFAEETLRDFLPFVKEELDYLDEKDAEKIVSTVDSAIEHIKPYLTKDTFSEDDEIMDFLDDKYSKEDLIEKIIEFDNDEFLNKLLNNNQE